MTSAAGASTVIDWVDCSAMRAGYPLRGAGEPVPGLCYSWVAPAGYKLHPDVPARGRGRQVPPGRGRRGPGVREFSVPVVTGSARRGTDRPARDKRRRGRRRDRFPRPAGRPVAGRHLEGVRRPGRRRSPRASSPPGVAAGDRVALEAKTRYEWTLLDFAIWTAGAVTVVPIYETSSADQVAWILSDSGATAVVVERDEHAARRVGARPGAGAAVRSTSSRTAPWTRSPGPARTSPTASSRPGARR